ncbi:uncharacterized protein LOC110709232 [Chenopodium quinoa]|uniref:uncharacterized protein LOC110709232 n=1 Tax=Chenopodium quinoa TaxID=63459 RepID=UPI000B77ABAB|nr:uncharacterized protein LOC110709232 [Chenopodium quinoa]
MIQEDQNQMCSTNNCGDRPSSSSKKLKQKRVPQRGLGVAQLEKIRMEEQQKKDGNNFSSSSQISPTNSPSHHGIPLPNFAITTNQNPSKSCVPPYSPPSPPPIPMSLSPPNPVFRACSLPNTENFHLGPVPFLSPTNGDGFQVGWPSIPVHGNFNFPKLWHANPHEFSHDHIGENAIFPPSLSLPFEDCSVAPLSDVLPRSTLQHQPPSSLVNGLSSPSVLNFPMEPPSNQSFYANYPPLCPDEEKMMIGMKRSCPFPLDSPPIPTFHSKFAPVITHPLSRSNESTSNGNGGTTTYNLGYSSNPIFSRDIPSCPITMPAEPANARKINISENGNSHTGEFLSLAPTTLTSSFPNSRLKQFCKYDTLRYQVSIEDTVMDSRQAGPSQQPNLLSFFPSTKLEATTLPLSPPASLSSCNTEVGESIDLNLRL